MVFAEHSLEYDVKLEVGGYDVIKKYVELGLGISIVMSHCLYRRRSPAFGAARPLVPQTDVWPGTAAKVQHFHPLRNDSLTMVRTDVKLLQNGAGQRTSRQERDRNLGKLNAPLTYAINDFITVVFL